ncbi:hypothetical protein [Actinokineospora pegani]|uniref:hypothetical protein n=1 Tax=Actinokineospora pegani TaxID=2654637 RepID=UPI0012EAB5DD|nr:hypothetical protein [Actinokineospora pegani]
MLVLDKAETAADHDEVYQALLGSPLVSGVICLAMDSGDVNGDVRVRPAPSLAPVDRAATLWVGDHDGIRWRPTGHGARDVRRSTPSGLDQLIDALAAPAVFEAVLEVVSTLPFSTAGIGMELERTSLGYTELRRVQEEAVAHFTDPHARQATMQEPPRDEFRAAIRAVVKVDRSEAVLTPGGALDAARTRAVEALNAAGHELTRLDHLFALFPKQRAGRVVGAAVIEAHAAARDLHDKVTRQLVHVDDSLRGRSAGQGPGLGVLGPVPARPRQVRDDTRRLLEGWLRKYRSIPHLLTDLDAARIEQEPQGCLDALDELRALRPQPEPEPSFEIRPRLRTAAWLSALTGVLAAIGMTPWAFISGLAFAWFAVGVLLHARRPTVAGESGFVTALRPASAWGLPVYGPWLVALVLRQPQVPEPWTALPTALAVLTFAWVAITSWRRSVRRWRRALGLAELRVRSDRTAQLLDTVLRVHWRTSARRALFAEGLRQVIEGATSVKEVLADRAGDLFTSSAIRPEDSVHADEQDRDIYEEVRDVVVADLVDLTIAAMRPCWSGIEAGRASESADYIERGAHLVGAYRLHVENHGLLSAPPFAFHRHHVHRDTLATRLWACSHVAEALSRGVEDEMTQLCHARQLGAVSALATGARLVRFASTAVRGLAADMSGPGPAVTWTENTEIAGTLRLVPLRQGVFQ